MTVAVKICCIASVAEARLAIAHGASALGLVSAMPSGPGVIADERIAEIAAAVAASPHAEPPTGPLDERGTESNADARNDSGAPRHGMPVRTFLLTARTRAEDIAAQHAACGTTTVQLVDHVPPIELRRLRALCPGVELVQVVHVTDARVLAEAEAAAPFVDALLLDSGNPALAVKQLGGTGRTHDWTVSRRIRDAVQPLPLWLAGGLSAANVAEAVRQVRPYGVDLCSSVRREGRLDAVRLAAFMTAVPPAP